MSLIDNLMVMKKIGPRLLTELKPYLESIEESQIVFISSKSGLPTLGLKEDETIKYIHSAYDPIQEAKVLARRFEQEDLSGYNHVFFYGIGLGYHVEEFLNAYPDKFFSLYEPNPHAFCHYLTQRRLDRLPLRRLKSLYVHFSPNDMEWQTFDFFHRFHDKPLFITLPSYERLFPLEYGSFTKYFVNSIWKAKTSRYTTLAWEKRWIINSMINFVGNLHNRNIFDRDPELFAGKPALMVASGPSLEDDIEHIRRVRDEGRAFVFAMGTAIKPLLNAGILPHAIISMDPSEVNQYTFSEIKQQNITSIPLIYGTSIGYEAIRDYPGPKLYMIMDRDTVTPYFFKNDDGGPMGMVNDAPSVAITALQLVSLLGCKPIMLAGQNLGFRNNQMYAKGFTFNSPNYTRDHNALEREIANALTVEDVYGNEMLTNNHYELYRSTIEMMISRFPQNTYINTTKGGAAIKGAPFMTIESLIEKQLTGKVVAGEWLDGIKAPHFDLKWLEKRLNKMRQSQLLLRKHLDELNSVITELKKKIQFANIRVIETHFEKIDLHFRAITRNYFYKTFLTPLNMLETSILGNNMAAIRAEILHARRAEKVTATFGRYVLECKRDMTHITDLLFTYIRNHTEQLLQQPTGANALSLQAALPDLPDLPNIVTDALDPDGFENKEADGNPETGLPDVVGEQIQSTGPAE